VKKLNTKKGLGNAHPALFMVYFVIVKKIKYKKKGLGNAHPA
jgi:hypothetical protein